MKLAFVIELGVGALKFLLLTFAALPSITFMTLPIATTVAGFVGYNYLSSDRELIALRTSGLSNAKIIEPAIRLSLFVTLFSYMIAFYISPISYNVLKNELSLLRSNYVGGLMNEHTFNQIAKNLIVYIDKKESDGSMSGIIIFDHRNSSAPTTLFAKNGKITLDPNSPSIELSNGFRQFINKNGDMNQMTFGNLVVNLTSSGNIRSKDAMDLQEFTISQLLFPVGGYSPERFKQIRSELHQRLIWPAYNTALMLLALSVFLKQKNSRVDGKQAIARVVISCAIVVYLHFSFHNLSLKYSFMNILCYINLFVTMAVGAFLTRD
jgi:lipopolysaccharide export system permease protein